jgi:hypothetical protein
MKTIVTLLLLCGLLLITFPVMAETPGLHGEVAFDWELAPRCPGQTWYVDLHYNVFSWLTIGFSETTHTNKCKMYYFIPSFVPDSQLYTVYAQINFTEKASLRLSQWCDHPVYYGQYISGRIPLGISVSGSYRF